MLFRSIFSLYSLYENAKEVHTFEPGEEKYNAIVNNLGDNFKNLIPNKIAISKNNGYIPFYEGESSLVSSTYFNKNSRVKNVFSTTVEDYFMDKKLNMIDFLKIDCEGAEYEIIENMNKTFLQEKINKVCLEYHIFNESDNILLDKMIKKLNECGFKTKIKNTMLYAKNQNFN